MYCASTLGPPTLAPTLANVRANDLREFGLQTIRHLCPCVRCSLALPAVLLSGQPGFHVAQTPRFPRFMALPPTRFAFGALLCKIDALAAVGTYVCSRPVVFSTGSALGALGSKSLQVYSRFCVHLSKTTVNADSHPTFCTQKATFELLAAVL